MHIYSANVMLTTLLSILCSLSTPVQPFSHFVPEEPAGRILSSPTHHFRSIKSGDWNDIANWQSSADGQSWQAATAFPDHNAESVLIRAGHQIKIVSAVSARRLTIEAGAVLDQVADDGGRILTIYDDGNDASDFKIFGTYHLHGRLPVFEHNVNATVYNGGIVRVLGNAGPKESEKFAESHQVRFLHGSLFDWSTTDEFRLNGTIFSPDTHADSVAVFRISQPVQTTSSGADGHINGLFEVNAPTALLGAGKKFFRNGIIGSSELNHINENHGALYIKNAGGKAILGGDSLQIKLTRRMYAIGHVSIPENSSVTISGGHLRTDSSGLTFSIHGRLDMTDQNITNAGGNVIISRTGHYRTAHSGGFTGTNSSIPSGNVVLEPGNTLELYADSGQSFQSRNDFSNLIFSGSGVKRPSKAFSFDGTMFIKNSAIVDAGTSNIGGPNSNLVMTGGRLIVGTTGTQPSMQGTYELTGGVVEFSNSATTAQTIRNRVYHIIEVTGGNVRNSTGKIEIRRNGKFIVRTGAAFFSQNGNAPIVGHRDVADGQMVEVENQAIFYTLVKAGLYGDRPSQSNASPSIQSSVPIITLHPGSTVEYARPDSLAGGGDQQISNAYNLVYQNLVLSGSGDKTAPKGVLKIKGDFIQKEDAVFKHNAGTVSFIGEPGELQTEIKTDTQRIDAPNAKFYNLENNSTSVVRIDSDISVQNNLRLNENTKLFVHGGDITLISDRYGTASVEKIPASASIRYTEDGGRFVVERYIEEHAKAWQLLSIPAFGGTIRESYQNNQTMVAGRGTTITGPFADWNMRGFDRHSPAPSMKYFVPETNLFAAITTTHDIISKLPAYFLFVRGDRSVAEASGDGRMAVTLPVRGKLYTPQEGYTPPIAHALPGKWALIGNPYASAIAYHKLQKSEHLSAEYYIWDPNLTQGEYSSYGLGAYRSIVYIDEDDGYGAVPGGGNYPAKNAPPIQSGQAFFVFNLSETEAGTILFSEDAKTAGNANVFRTQMPGSRTGKIRTNLFVNVNGEQILLDGTLHLLRADVMNTPVYHDARKIWNSNENLSIPSEKYPLVVKRMAYPAEGDTLFYSMTGMKKQTYALQITTENMQPGFHEVIFNDRYLKKSSILSHSENKIAFTINDDSASARPDRFFLTFRKMLPPLAFKDLKASNGKEGVSISWNTEYQTHTASFVLEHSEDQQRFLEVHHQKASADEHGRYNASHAEPAPGWNYYRIKAHLKDGRIVASENISVYIPSLSASISLYPTLAKDWLYLEFRGQPSGTYRARLISANGATVLSKTIRHPGSNQLHSIFLQNVSSGWYQLEMIKPGGQRFTCKLMIR